MPVGEDGAGSALEPFQFTDAASCRAWLGRLAGADAAARHASFGRHVRQVPEALLAPAVKLEVLEMMREAVHAAQAGHAKDHRGRAVPLNPRHRAAWQETVGLWRALASAYESLIADMAEAAPELATHAALICQRVLRYTGLAMGEYNRAYHSVPEELWQQLHRLYVFAENAVVATTRVRDGVERIAAETTCTAAYVRSLLAQLAQPDALTVRQMDMVDRWLDHWEGLVSLSPEPSRSSTVAALAVDLMSQKGAALAKQMPAAGVRHLNLDHLGRTLRQASASLKKGRTPWQIGLGELRPDVCEMMLVLLYIQWCAAGTGRVDERTTASMSVRICPGIASIHHQLTGRPIRQPEGEPTLRVVRNGSMPEWDEPPPAATETWAIVNKSASGFLGLCRKPDVNAPVGHRQLLGLKAGPEKDIYVGIVQRLHVDANGAVWVGLRLISASPQPAAVRAAEERAGDSGGGAYERALLLPEDAARNVPATLLLPPKWYRPERELEVHTGKGQRIRLRALLEEGPNFERATYSAG
jgi:hypothetical protein